MTRVRIEYEPKKCAFCKNTFRRKSGELSCNWKRRKFCSYKCSYDNKRKGYDIICEHCKNVFHPARQSRRFCSLKCMICWRELMVKDSKIFRTKLLPMHGDTNVNWKGGVTKLNEAVRKLAIYSEWRAKVFRRDNYTCQDCFKKVRAIEAHHIKEFSIIMTENKITSVEDAIKCIELWDIDNGSTLCKECHRKTFKKVL